jgi:hypothetical protein
MTGVPMVRDSHPPAQFYPQWLQLHLFWPSQVSFTQAEFAQNGSTLPYKRVREKIQGIPIYLRL